MGWTAAERFDAVKDGLGLEDHAFAAAEGTVVHGAMAVVGEVAQVVGGDVDRAAGDGPAQDSVVERAGEEVGEDGEDVEAHGHFSGAARLGWRLSSARPSGRAMRMDFGGGVERDEEGAGEGDEELVAGGGGEDEERCGGVEAARAVGGGGEVDGGDRAEGLAAVVDGAADEVGDVGGAGVEGRALGQRDEDFVAGERCGLLDAVDSGEAEDDAAGVTADGKPMRGDLGGPD